MNFQSPTLVSTGYLENKLNHYFTGVNSNVLIVHDGGTVSSHGLLLDDTDELKGAAERSVGVWPFRALKMSHLQDIVVLLHTGQTHTHIG